MPTEHRPIKYTDEHPIDIGTHQFASLICEIKLRVEQATADLGDFGIGMTANDDGHFSIGFGPNMTVHWDVLAALPALLPVFVTPREQARFDRSASRR